MCCEKISFHRIDLCVKTLIVTVTLFIYSSKLIGLNSIINSIQNAFYIKVEFFSLNAAVFMRGKDFALKSNKFEDHIKRNYANEK